jgi:hydroxymethylpyrimidine/phosphomethylpyrimidine kinase
MVSTSGSQLLPEDAVSTLIEKILPLTTVLTPNLPEAILLLKTAYVSVKDPENVDDIVSIAKEIQKLGPKFVLLKGGHLPLTKGRVVSKDEADRDVVLNVLYGEGEVTLLETPYQKSRNTHGTGCSLACKLCILSLNIFADVVTAAIACNLASRMTVINAVKKSNLYVEAGIRTSKDVGKGSGPINHFHSTYTLPFAPYAAPFFTINLDIELTCISGGFIEYLLNREDVQAPWKAYTHHDFVQRLANDTLPVENFKHYLTQDYLFLVRLPSVDDYTTAVSNRSQIHFARANALASYKAKSMADVARV